MTELIDLDPAADPDFPVMCEFCEVKFYIVFERKQGVSILSFCPFCGEEFTNV